MSKTTSTTSRYALLRNTISKELSCNWHEGALYSLILKKLSGKNRNERFSERHFHFLGSHFVAIYGGVQEQGKLSIITILLI